MNVTEPEIRRDLNDSADIGITPGLKDKLAYTVGAVPYAAGFDTAIDLIFFYYAAVLGLSGTLVGAALALSLVIDAFADPAIGSWSDNVRSRWGRRLPLMALSAPLMICGVALLFGPPTQMPPPMLFIYLTAMLTFTRVSISLFYVPHFALGGEMSEDYIERSSIVAWRAAAGLATRVLVTILAFNLFFTGPGGMRDADAYPGLGMAIGLLIGGAALVCCFGLRNFAPKLRQAHQDHAALLKRLPAELAEIFRNRSFRLLFLSAVVFYVALGVNNTLQTHANIFVWRLDTRLIQLLAYAFLAGILAGIVVTPSLSRKIEKRTIVTVGLTMVIVVWLILPSLRAAGLFTPTGNATLVPLAINGFIAGIGAGFCAVAYPSMMADAADEHELLHGRRREGLYFAGLGFAGKTASGAGALVAGIALDLIRFPRDTTNVPLDGIAEPALRQLMLAHGPLAAIIAMASIAIFWPYSISRTRHAEILSIVRERRASQQ